ncbi:MAG: DUF2288 family protein [Gammaproteobacteria bacterium]|nr:DUF2288 family protein [Gammaproteobacteria bacterium]
MEGKLLGETARCGFADLVRPFAKGQLVEVVEAVDLIAVAQALNRDDAQQFQAWINEGVVSRVSDDRAKDWTSRDPELWAVVVAPWVLVQEKSS